ncbi:DUF5018 domain-containing protein [uncultured Proteiniphilum sp.]|uniref:DUF5018 domain-containing protein n=1 Tax=uncultured Proteiniphilum sp. TaxID=497637 RepID=UPI00260D872C|nr:DUF5018 domain-containing protein [uncultured Proteiniphilum sp.]
MKTYIKWMKLALTGFLLFVISVSCSDPLYELPDIKATGTDITEFSLNGLSCTINDEKGSITIEITPDYDLSLLKNLVPSSLKLSPYATISPEKSVSQDFSKDIQYTVTAENGSQKVWTVTPAKYEELDEGVGYIKLVWYKSLSDLGLTSNIENTVATFGDYIVVSRTGLIFDGKTGEKAGKLNMEGIAGGNDSQKVPFILANDSEGNLIGGTLTAWSGNVFYVYKWDALDQPPSQILAYPLQSGKDTQFGRKMSVVGNINDNAYIIGDDYAAENNRKMNCWKVTGGIVNPVPDIIETDMQNYNQAGYSLVFPLSALSLKPYFYFDSGHISGSDPSTVLKYMDENNNSTTISPQGGWGRNILHSIYFTFNNKNYLSVISITSDFKYKFFVIDPSDLSSPIVKFSDIREYDSKTEGNGNNTGGVAIKRVSSGLAYVYTLMTSKGIACYMLTNYSLIDK